LGLDTNQEDYTCEVLDSRRAFRHKRYPDVNISKFKARFCWKGQQAHGINYFVTLAPEVAWTNN